MKEKIYIVYDKNTKEVRGNENSLSSANKKIEEDNKKDNSYFELAKEEHRIIRDYRNCDIVEEEEENWKNHIKTYPEITKIENVEEIENDKGKKIKKGKLKAYKREKTLEKLKNEKISLRKVFMTKTRNDWVFDSENMPQNIKNKYNQARDEIKEIELIDNKEDLIIYNNFEE